MPVIVSGALKIYVSRLVWIRRKMHEFSSTMPPFPPFGPGVDCSKQNNASICFLGMENTCANFGPGPSENAWFCNKPTPSPIWPLGLVFRYDHTRICFWENKNMVKFGPDLLENAFFFFSIKPISSPIWSSELVFSVWNHINICLREMKNTYSKFGPNPSENARFCINPTLYSTILAPGIGFPKWNSVSICFRDIKNNVTNLVQICRKLHDLVQPHSLFPHSGPRRFFVMKPCQYLFQENEKYMCQVWPRSIGKCIILHQSHPLFCIFITEVRFAVFTHIIFYFQLSAIAVVFQLQHSAGRVLSMLLLPQHWNYRSSLNKWRSWCQFFPVPPIIIQSYSEIKN